MKKILIKIAGGAKYISVGIAKGGNVIFYVKKYIPQSRRNFLLCGMFLVKNLENVGNGVLPDSGCILREDAVPF